MYKIFIFSEILRIIDKIVRVGIFITDSDLRIRNSEEVRIHWIRNTAVFNFYSLLLQERQKVHCLNTLFSKLRINQVQYWTLVPAQLIVLLSFESSYISQRNGQVSTGTNKKV